MRSHVSMISAMLWSISSTPAPCSSLTERTTAANVGHLRLGQPRRRLVEQDEARLRRERAGDAEPPLVAVCERRCRRVGVAGEPEPLEQIRRRAALRPVGRPRRRAPPPRRSRARTAPRNAWLCWNVRASPCWPRRCGDQLRDVAALEQRPSLVGPVEAAEHVHERRLARTVRADQPDDLAARELERHAAQRLHALEGPRDRGGPEGFSGPPLLLRSTASAVAKSS